MRTSISSLLALVALSLPLCHCSSDPAIGPTPPKDAGPDAAEIDCTEGPAPSAVAGFTRYTLEQPAHNPAYAATGDLNGDGRPDIVVTKFGPVSVDPVSSAVTLSKGEVSVYYQGKSLNCWKKADISAPDDKLYFPNQPVLADVDGDGDLDVLVSAGFFVCAFDKNVGDCGTLVWYENTKAGFVRHDVVPFGDDHFYHKAIFGDFDGDKIPDLVTVGEATDGPKAKWFKGDTSKDRFAKAALSIGDGLGSFPSVLDLDGDGDLDVASAEFFTMPVNSFAWFERTAEPSPAAPGGAFSRHVINGDSLKGLMLGFVPNLYGDGVLRAVGTNHTNTQKSPPDAVESAVFAFDIPKDPTSLWPKKQISTGIVSRPNSGFSVMAAPGIFGHGDVDGDGDIDLVVSGDGDAHTYWMEQTSPGTFAMHIIEESLGQAGGAIVTDLDGDGRSEVIFTGYEDSVVYLYGRAK